MVVASLYVFGTVLPWNSVQGGTRSIPMVVYLTLSMIVFSMLTAQMSGPGVPRPSYGRMFAIFLGTGGLTALLLLFSRDYFSRMFLIVTAVSWLVLATAHRMVRRRRPWTERIAAHHRGEATRGGSDRLPPCRSRLGARPQVGECSRPAGQRCHDGSRPEGGPLRACCPVPVVFATWRATRSGPLRRPTRSTPDEFRWCTWPRGGRSRRLCSKSRPGSPANERLRRLPR